MKTHAVAAIAAVLVYLTISTYWAPLREEWQRIVGGPEAPQVVADETTTWHTCLWEWDVEGERLNGWCLDGDHDPPADWYCAPGECKSL